MKNVLTYIITLSILLGISISSARAAHSPEITDRWTGKAVPTFNCKGINGKNYTQKDFTGKPTVVNFYASWCPPCRTEIRHLKQLKQQFGDKVSFFGVLIDSVETPDTVGKAKEMLASNPLPYPVLLMTKEMKDGFKFEGIPSLYLITKEGKFSTTLLGPQTKPKIESHIKKLIK